MQIIQDQERSQQTDHSIPQQARTIQSLFNDCFQVTNGKPVYHFEKCIFFLQELGKQTYGIQFRIYEEDIPLILKLVGYFIKDKNVCSTHGLNPMKGVLLSGPIGCGKTSLMTLVRNLLPLQKQYIVKSCRHVAFEFIKGGYGVLDRYSSAAPYSYHSSSILFDDLGTETNIKFYGNECNVLAEILLNRYDLFVQHGIETHLTTNLNSSEIEKYYGPRVRSRLREMFNLISFGDVADKRH